MKLVRTVLVLIAVAMIAGSGPSAYARRSGGWSDTIYYDSADWNYAVGERVINGGCNLGLSNWGVTTEWKEVSSDYCDGGGYSCHRCAFINGVWYCDWLCAN